MATLEGARAPPHCLWACAGMRPAGGASGRRGEGQAGGCRLPLGPEGQSTSAKGTWWVSLLPPPSVGWCWWTGKAGQLSIQATETAREGLAQTAVPTPQGMGVHPALWHPPPPGTHGAPRCAGRPGKGLPGPHLPMQAREGGRGAVHCLVPPSEGQGVWRGHAVAPTVHMKTKAG